MTSSENPLTPIHHPKKVQNRKCPFFQIEPRTLSASLEGLNQRWTKNGVWTPHVFLRMGSLRTFFVGGGGDRFFFLIFFANLKLMVTLNFSWNVLLRISFTDSIEFFYGQRFVFACTMQNLILFRTFKRQRLGILVWPPYDLLIILILCMWFCNLFNGSTRQPVSCS